jgi:hypothetical protein
VVFCDAGNVAVAPLSVPVPAPCHAPPTANDCTYAVQVPVLATVTDCAGPAVAPAPTLMLPAVTASVSNISVFGVVGPAPGLVGNGDGAPAGAASVLVMLTEVPAANVVPLWKVMFELHAPSAGKLTGVPTANVDTVAVAEAGAVPQGKAASGLLELLGAGDGLAEATATGVVLTGAPLQLATIKPAATTKAAAAKRNAG